MGGRRQPGAGGPVLFYAGRGWVSRFRRLILKFQTDFFIDRKWPGYSFTNVSSYPLHNLPYEKVGDKEPVCIADEVPFEIPESWEWVRLGSISTYAQTKQKINARDADSFLWGLDLEDIEKGGRLLAKKAVGERKAVGDKVCFDKGDILYSKLRPYLLKILIAPDSGICTPEIVPFKLYGSLNSEYIVAFLKCPYVDTAINSVTYGVKMPRVGTETMVSFFVPIPPLDEQARIVDKLKEILSYVDHYGAAYSQAETLNASFPEHLKKSILQEAIQGKLVPQNPNDEPASVLLERIRAEKEQLIREGKIKRDKHESIIFRRDNSYYEKVDGIERCIDDEVPFDVPDSWLWTRLGSIITLLSGTDYKPDEYNDNGEGTPYITGASNLSVSGVLVNRWTEKPRVIAHNGDLLIVCKGSGYGKTVICDIDSAHIARQIMAIKNTGLIEIKYIRCFLDANLQFLKAKGQGVIPGIDRGSILEMLFPLPPLAEQKRIAEKIESILPILKTL